MLMKYIFSLLLDFAFNDVSKIYHQTQDHLDFLLCNFLGGLVLLHFTFRAICILN